MAEDNIENIRALEIARHAGTKMEITINSLINNKCVTPEETLSYEKINIKWRTHQSNNVKKIENVTIF